MSGGALSLIVDGVIVALLVATIGYAFVLNRKLRDLRATKGEMDALVARLVEASDRAHSGLSGLREHARASGEELQHGIAAARARSDELGFLIERADALAATLEGSIGTARARSAGATVGRAAAHTAARASAPAPAAGPATKAGSGATEAGLLKTLQGLR